MGRKVGGTPRAIVYSPVGSANVVTRPVGGTVSAGNNFLTTDANGNLVFAAPPSSGGGGGGGIEGSAAGFPFAAFGSLGG